MNKYYDCIWANKVNTAIIHCPFQRCAQMTMFITDRRGNAKTPYHKDKRMIAT